MGRLRFPSPEAFFGLTDENNANAYSRQVYEHLFILKHYGGWSFLEAYNLPIKLRTFFIERLVKEIEKHNEQMEKAASKK